MSKYDDTNVPHLNELTGAKHIKPENCDYCERGWSKGFHTCPSCGTEVPDGYFDDEGENS